MVVNNELGMIWGSKLIESVKEMDVDESIKIATLASIFAMHRLCSRPKELSEETISLIEECQKIASKFLYDENSCVDYHVYERN